MILRYITRNVVLRKIVASTQNFPTRGVHLGNPFPYPPRIPILETPQDAIEARSWVSLFKNQAIPKGLVDFSFSRSSGPGGQNVNKLNTKATLRCAVNSSWIPEWARQDLRKSPHYVSSTDSILITSTVHRSQAQNIDDCLHKLRDLVISASLSSIRNEPSEEQRKRVVRLEQAEKANRRREKSRRSEVKQSRSKGRGGWD
ncbi:RF-1 domain-containing protein [Infundibulicybe gibba]|nr:RF-1 domain-containing protein [Infundibulicybe gibba]